MSFNQKDTSEVAEFMVLFAQLKTWCDDEPDQLADSAKSDSSIRDLCIEVSFAASFLKMTERSQRALFVAPADPAFVVAWRDFEARYESVLARISLEYLFPEMADGAKSPVMVEDFGWDVANDEAADQASGIDEVIELARYKIENDSGDLDETFVRNIEEGLSAWERLCHETGFNLQGIFRRRALVPFVLIPRKVAAKQGNVKTLSLLANLQQAHDTFVFGSSYAALALMRSIAEAVLRDHYDAAGPDLSERIRNAQGRLPPQANAAALHQLRKLANAVLHLNPERGVALDEWDIVRLEKEIVRFLFVLRALIEGVR